MRRTTADFTTVLQDLDFSDNIASLSTKFNDLVENTERLTNEAARVGLKLNTGKCKTLGTEHVKSKERIVVNQW